MTIYELKKIVSEFSDIQFDDLTKENNQDWDSLAHLAILTALSKALGDKISDLDCLTKSLNFKELTDCLSSKNILSND